jgi:hypothetical protein
VDAQNNAVRLSSFFKRRSYDYTDEEFNLPQGHVDRIRTVDLTPKTESVMKTPTMIPFSQQIGWSVQQSFIPLSTAPLDPRHGDVSRWVTS